MCDRQRDTRDTRSGEEAVRARGAGRPAAPTRRVAG